MPLTKLQFRPGINREITSYSNEGGWHDCDKVRFTKGFPEKIGGWVKKGVLSFLGTARAMHPWRDLIGTRLIGLGTDLKFYVEEGGGYNDITPIRTTTAAGDVTFAATDGSSPKLSCDQVRRFVVRVLMSVAEPQAPRLQKPAPQPLPYSAVSRPELIWYAPTVLAPPLPVSELFATTSVGASSPSTVMLEMEVPASRT